MSLYINGIINYYYPPVLTSFPSPTDDDEGFASTFTGFSGRIVPNYNYSENFQGNGITSITGILNYPLKTYTMPYESFQGNGITSITGQLKYTLVSYTITPITQELLDANPPQIVNITSRVALVQYQNYPPEGIDVGGYQITGGSLS